MNVTPSPLRLLVVPGLRDSGPAHWQTWLEGRSPGGHINAESGHGPFPLAEQWLRLNEARLAAEPLPGRVQPVALAA